MHQPLYNLHNHTPFSDGAYDVDKLCEAHRTCKDVKFDGVGISDHLFRTPSSREIESERDFVRTFANETRNYVELVHTARRRWAGKLQILCGCEINWPLNKPHLDAIRTLLNGIDYVLFEFVDWAGLTLLANQARRWPCPVGLARTDVSRQFPTTSMDQVVRTMANARIFYEVSVSLMPLASQERWFNILPNHRVAITIGTNTHDDLGCIRQVAQLLPYLEQRGLTERFLLPKLRIGESGKPEEAATAQATRLT